MSELDNDTQLSAEETAYFESRGEVDTPPPQAAPETAEGATAEGAPGQGQEQSQGDGEQPQRRTTMVPHAALHEAREDLKREREERRRFEETVNQRLSMLMPGNQPQQKQEPAAPPDPNENPIEAINWLRNQVETQNQNQAQMQRQQQEHMVLAQVESFAQQDEAQARKQAPDYDAAKQHLMMSRGQELFLASGGRATDDQIRRQLAQEERALRIQAIQSGRRPAEVVYHMARARGYQPQAPAKGEGEGEEKIANIAAAQAENRTLSAAGGTPAGGPMTAERLAQMSEKEFADYTAKNPAAFRRLAGG